MVDTLLVRFDVKHSFYIPASTGDELESTTDDDVVTDRPFRQPVGGMMWLARKTRPNIADASRAVARYSHNPCERHWVTVEKILAYLTPRGI